MSASSASTRAASSVFAASRSVAIAASRRTLGRRLISVRGIHRIVTRTPVRCKVLVLRRTLARYER